MLVESPSPKTEDVVERDLSVYNGMNECLMIIRTLPIIPISIRDGEARQLKWESHTQMDSRSTE